MVKSTKQTKQPKATARIIIVSGGIITRGYCVLGMCNDNVEAELEKYKKCYGDCRLTCAVDASAEAHFDDIKKKIKEFMVDGNDCIYHLQISNFKEEVKAITGVTKFNMLPKKGSSTDADDKPKKAVAKKDPKKKDEKEKAPAKGKKGKADAKDEKEDSDDAKKKAPAKKAAAAKKSPAAKADEKKKTKEESEAEESEEEEESEDESDEESEEESDD